MDKLMIVINDKENNIVDVICGEYLEMVHMVNVLSRHGVPEQYITIIEPGQMKIEDLPSAAYKLVHRTLSRNSVCMLYYSENTWHATDRVTELATKLADCGGFYAGCYTDYDTVERLCTEGK